MIEELEEYEDKIKTKHAFGFTPKYTETFTTSVSATQFMALALKVVEDTEWNLVYKDENSIEVKCSEEVYDKEFTEKLTVTYTDGRVTATSVSLKADIWDKGDNSRRVKMFIYAFELYHSRLGLQGLTQLAEKAVRAENMDDYVIPDTLPQPVERKPSNFYIPLAGGLAAAIAIGLLFAQLTLHFRYFPFLYEVAAVYLIGFCLKYLMRVANCTAYNYTTILAVACSAVIFLTNESFIYMHLSPGSFAEFTRLRAPGYFDAGIITILLMAVLWLLQTGFTAALLHRQILVDVTEYQVKRIPKEVFDFAYYQLVKGKDEEQMRYELTRMGWRTEQQQNEVFEAIGAIQVWQEFVRGE